jgi:hypothetical protein
MVSPLRLLMPSAQGTISMQASFAAGSWAESWKRVSSWRIAVLWPAWVREEGFKDNYLSTFASINAKSPLAMACEV